MVVPKRWYSVGDLNPVPTLAFTDDPGTHVDQLCDAPLATDLLGNWVRGRNVLTVEQAVRKLAGEPADTWAVAERYHEWLLATDVPKVLFWATPGAVVSPVAWREVEPQGRQPRTVAGIPHVQHEGIIHVAPVQRVGMADHDACGGADGQCQAGLERHASRSVQRDVAFSYHAPMRITVGGRAVQRPC